MTVVVTPTPPLFPAADAFRILEDATISSLLKDRRRQAFEALHTLPWPTVRDEEWRRTDPALFPFENVTISPPLPEVVRETSHELDELFDVIVDVDENGYCIRDRGGITGPGGVIVASLEKAANVHEGLLDIRLHGPAVIEENRIFTEINNACWNFGLFIHVPRNCHVERGVLIRYNITRSNFLLVPKLVVAAEAGSAINVVELFNATDDCPVMCVSARELYVDEAAHLQVFGLQEWGRSSYHIGEDWGQVGRDARIDWVTLSLGGRASKSTMGCNVSAPNANAYLSGLFFADRDQHVDQRTLQQHAAPHTYSNLLYKGAVKDQGHSVYQGIIAAKPGAIKVDAYQMNNNLVLSTGARADSLPGLKIDADDLKCSHGSTMGNLDPDQMFYLRTRGFSESEARRMLVLAFFEEIIEKIPYEFLRDRVREDVNRKV